MHPDIRWSTRTSHSLSSPVVFAHYTSLRLCAHANVVRLERGGEPFRELQEPFRHLANRSANCKSLSAIWRTAPRTARAFPPFGEPFRELQEPFRHLANRSANCKSLSAIWRTAPRTARAFPPFGEPFRELQEPFCHLANRSANCKTLITRTMGGHTIVISHINIGR